MKKPLMICAILTLIPGLWNCQNQKQSGTDNLLVVCVDDIGEREVLLSDLVETCEFVRLDNQPEALLNYPAYFAVSANYILITDALNKPAKLFSSKGHFIRDLGAIGKGPEEYMTVVSPYIDEEREHFWLLRGGNYSQSKEGWLMVYDRNGQLIDQIDGSVVKRGLQNANPELVYNNQLVLLGNVNSPDMLVHLSLKTGKIIQIPSRLNPNTFTYSNGSVVYPRGEQFIFKIGESDTIYAFNPKTATVIPEAVIFTRKHKYDEKAIRMARKSQGPERFANIQSATEGGYSIKLAGETDRYYLLHIRIEGSNFETKLLAVDKEDHSAFFVNLINDFSENEPIPSVSLRWYNNSYLVIYLPQTTAENENDALYICKIKQP